MVPQEVDLRVRRLTGRVRTWVATMTHRRSSRTRLADGALVLVGFALLQFSSALLGERRGMFRLVDADFPAARQRQTGDGSPPLFAYGGAYDVLYRHFGDESVDVIAHEIELVHVVLFGRVHRDLGGRKREDEPAVAGVGEGELEDVAEERAVRIGVFAVENDVGGADHGRSVSDSQGTIYDGTSSPRAPSAPFPTRYHARDLASPPGNKLEALKGDRKGQHSIRINDQWRICFRWTVSGPQDVEIVDYH